MKKRVNFLSIILKRGAQGFTLLEVMVTLTILGFILLMVFGVFRLGVSAWEKGDSTRDESQRIRMVPQMIIQQIKSVVPYKIKTEKAEGDYLAFEGKSRSLKLVSALPIRAGRPEGLVYAVYEFKEGGKEGGRLILYEQRVLNRDFFSDPPKEELGVALLEGIAEVRFEYYREEDAEKNRTAEWVGEWNAKEEKELPKALKLTITPAGGKTEKEKSPLTLLTPIPANRFEEVRTVAPGVGRRAIRMRLPGRGN